VRRGLGLGDVVADRFKLVAEIGEGGMGRVFEAIDLLHDRRAAVKVIYRRLAADEVFRERFEREALAAERATHPHVLPVWDHGAAGDHLYLATPLCDTDLASVLEEHGRLEPEVALNIIGQIAWALDWAHGRDVVHRDVKPENILLVAGPVEQHAYLADFGLARIATSATLTQFGVSVGLSPAYAAPEQWLGKRVTPAADQYALAGTLYCCLAGRSPFWPIHDFEGLREAHLEQHPQPMRHAADPRVEVASTALLRAFEKDPAQRYPSCGDLVVAVREVVQREMQASSSAPGAGEYADPHATTEPEQPSSARAQGRPEAPIQPHVGASARPPPAAGFADPADETTRPAEWIPETTESAGEPTPGPDDGAAERAPARRRVLLASLALVLIAAGIGAALILRDGSGEAAGEVLPAVQVGVRPADAFAAGGFVWIADHAAGTFTRLDPRTAEPNGAPVPVVEAPFRLSGADGRLWAISAAGAEAGGVDTRARTAEPVAIDLPGPPSDVSVGEGAVWIVVNPRQPGESDRLLALDPVSGEIRNSVRTAFAFDAVAAGEGAVWVLESRAGRLHRVRPQAPAVVETVRVGPGSSAVVTDPSGVWVANGRAGRLLRIDPRNSDVAARIPVERGSDIRLAAGGGAIWWIDRDGGTLIRFDADSGRQVGTAIHLGAAASGATVAGDTLWVTVPATGSVERVRF
jgi:DNA-binding beta-propeller fold protein YncE